MNTLTSLHPRKSLSQLALFAAVCSTALTLPAAETNPYLGRWALTIPGGGAGWLEVSREPGYYRAEILWGGGSVVPVSSVCFADDALYLTRVREVQRKDAAGKVVRTQQVAEAIVGWAEGDTLRLTRMNPRDNGEGIDRAEFIGHRIPALPPAPDLSKVTFGEPISLFNGRDLTGWRLTDAHARSGWSAVNGELVNDPKQTEGQPHIHYGNLRTDREFEDFNLTLEANIGQDQNSGIYLRGIYEVQVADSFGKPLDSHHMGGIYSRIRPTVNAEKPAGEWQSYDITLVDRHVTVILNGQKIIDNQPLAGCTGGALWSDESRPGPLYLQGDHTGVRYRNFVLRPVVTAR